MRNGTKCKRFKRGYCEIAELRKEFWKDVKIPGNADEYNEELAKAGRVADFLELGELFAKDALQREESVEVTLEKNTKHRKAKLAK